jgi:hypothetical protein
LARFGVGLEDREQRQKHSWTHLADAWEYTLLAIKYDAFDHALLSMIMFRDTGERGERLARLVCAAFLLAWSKIPGILAATIEAFQKAVPRIANEPGLAEFLTAHLVTHTSLWRNLRLRAGIDELREEGESLFARLLKEYPAEAVAAYDERPRNWGDLMDLRTKVARRLEKRDAPPGANELATFIEREREKRLKKLLKWAKELGKDAGLTPREYQLFALVMGDPERFLSRNDKLNHSKAAQAMGVAVGTTKSLWSRTKKKIFAA